MPTNKSVAFDSKSDFDMACFAGADPTISEVIELIYAISDAVSQCDCLNVKNENLSLRVGFHLREATEISKAYLARLEGNDRNAKVDNILVFRPRDSSL